uniref:Uncharacterized protein n=1 Tax=Arundo donax TaxID=35708 RepID=A0A0A9B4S5_ARUDO
MLLTRILEYYYLHLLLLVLLKDCFYQEYANSSFALGEKDVNLFYMGRKGQTESRDQFFTTLCPLGLSI